jgi:hypothetical protein
MNSNIELPFANDIDLALTEARFCLRQNRPVELATILAYLKKYQEYLEQECSVDLDCCQNNLPLIKPKNPKVAQTGDWFENQKGKVFYVKEAYYSAHRSTLTIVPFGQKATWTVEAKYLNDKIASGEMKHFEIKTDQ